MSTDEESGLGSLGFFSGVPVDDKKYETLLEDLRAHDLLGPVDDGFDSVGYGGRTSLLLNDSLSAIFSGNLPKDKPTGPPLQPASAPKVAKAPPPGFAATPAGSAPTQADLEWARSQQEFALLRNEFAKKVPGGAVGLTSAGLGLSKPFLYSEDDDEDDDALLENINMKTFGLDEDDDFRARAAAPTPDSLPVPKLPSPPPGMPSAPPGLPSPPPGMPSHAPMPPQPVMMQPPPPGMGYPPAGIPPQPFPHHPGGPPHPHMMPPHHMMMYPPPPQMPQFNGPPPHVIMNEKIFKIMNPRDVQFVVQQQLKQIRSSDPFSDDYYFHNYHVKRERARANLAVPSPALPLPSWKLEHVKSFDPRDVSRANKSREWESENQVLGRTAKSSLYRPRELLNLADDTEPVLSRSKTPSNSVFFNDTWSKRQRIDEGMGYLLALQDARHILDARRINVQQFHQMDPQQMDPALIELRDKTANLLLELAKVLGVSATGECDKAVLWSILSVSKGKKLVCRALPLLHPSARFLLFPLLVQYMLAQTLTNEDQKSEETIADEDRLAQTLVVALLYQQPSPPPQALADSLQFALEGQSIPTLSLVLHNRTRAELLQALLQKGGTVCASTVDEVKAKWLKYQDLFVELASRIKESSQQHGGL